MAGVEELEKEDDERDVRFFVESECVGAGLIDPLDLEATAPLEEVMAEGLEATAFLRTAGEQVFESEVLLGEILGPGDDLVVESLQSGGVVDLVDRIDEVVDDLRIGVLLRVGVV